MGAKGIMQIMPGTYTEITGKNPHFLKVNEPRWNIAAGNYYDRLLYRKFKKTPEHEKLFLTLASYNAGYGRVLKAKKKTPTKDAGWDEIRPYLPGETRAYVHRIRKLMGEK